MLLQLVLVSLRLTGHEVKAQDTCESTPGKCGSYKVCYTECPDSTYQNSNCDETLCCDHPSQISKNLAIKDTQHFFYSFADSTTWLNSYSIEDAFTMTDPDRCLQQFNVQLKTGSSPEYQLSADLTAQVDIDEAGGSFNADQVFELYNQNGDKVYESEKWKILVEQPVCSTSSSAYAPAGEVWESFEACAFWNDGAPYVEFEPFTASTGGCEFKLYYRHNMGSHFTGYPYLHETGNYRIDVDPTQFTDGTVRTATFTLAAYQDVWIEDDRRRLRRLDGYWSQITMWDSAD